MDLTGATWRKSSYSTSTNCVDVALVGVTWRKSSHSAADNCVEVALEGAAWGKASSSANVGNCREVALTGATWRKASFSGNAGNCVEVAHSLPGRPGIVAVRDSTNPDGPALIIAATAWRAFTTTLRTTTPGTPKEPLSSMILKTFLHIEHKSLQDHGTQR